MINKFTYFFIFSLISINLFVLSDINISGYQLIEAKLKPIFRRSKKDFFIKRHFSSPSVKKTTGVSTNWAGYASLTNLTNPALNSVTQISGTWIVPKLSASSKDTFSSTWVGIDGFTSPTVEQIGTEQDWINGKQSNYAWFEMYPDFSFTIVNFTIQPGDLVTASVVYAGNSIFILSITNHTKKLHTVIPPKYTKSTVAQRSSAEWIMEAPFLKDVLPLAHFNKINFFNCTATINKIKGPINDKNWKNERIMMITENGALKAATSDLSCYGKNFSVVFKHE